MTFYKLMNLLAGLLLLFLNTWSYSQTYQSTLDVRLVSLPEVVAINGNQTIYYELLLTNFSPDSISVNAIEVMGNSNASVSKLTGNALTDNFQLIGIDQKLADGVIPPGKVAIIYMEVTWAKSQAVSRMLHRLELGKKGQDDVFLDGALIRLPLKKPLILGSPLKEGNWAAVYDPTWARGHRRVIYTTNGQAHIPGRFAIDFIKLDEAGRFAKGDEDSVANWYGYGMDVLAVAGGTVQSVQDIYPESKTLSRHPQYSPDRATGNYIALDIGNGRTVFYEHLKPGSIQVKIGQKLSKGEIIAAVGFTGQTTGPHLHLHVADKNAPLGAEGIPFVFDSFRVLGNYPDFSQFGKQRWKPNEGSAPRRSRERPGPNTVITFGRN